METKFIIIDNFYQNPDAVRERALNLDFNRNADYYPGRRSKPESEDISIKLREAFQQILHKEIYNWFNRYNTGFQYTIAGDMSWTHHDSTKWAGVIYLSPDAPIETGTGTFRLKESKVGEWDGVNNSDSDFNGEDILKWDNNYLWEATNLAGNYYNRLVLYKGWTYHRSLVPGFGTGKENGRLFQNFFFDVVD